MNQIGSNDPVLAFASSHFATGLGWWGEGGVVLQLWEMCRTAGAYVLVKILFFALGVLIHSAYTSRLWATLGIDPCCLLLDAHRHDTGCALLNLTLPPVVGICLLLGASHSRLLLCVIQHQLFQVCRFSFCLRFVGTPGGVCAAWQTASLSRARGLHMGWSDSATGPRGGGGAVGPATARHGVVVEGHMCLRPLGVWEGGATVDTLHR
jgi:hypothetical protein